MTVRFADTFYWIALTDSMGPSAAQRYETSGKPPRSEYELSTRM